MKLTQLITTAIAIGAVYATTSAGILDVESKKNVVGSIQHDAPIPTKGGSSTYGDDDDDIYQKKEKSVEEGGSSASNPFVMSVSMIIVSEIGDKTFLILLLMLMKLSRVVVFSALFAALAIMTILSGIVGHLLPLLIPQQFTQFLAGVLFVVFGYKLLNEGLSMSKEVGVDEEMAEVEEEIAMSDINQRMDATERGGSPIAMGGWKQTLLETLESLKQMSSLILSPLFVQVFVMTFLGEWGDRSQIATIAMAAGSDYWLVILGAIVGHGVCTGGAVIGGKLLATRISMRNVTLGGAAAFFIFAVLYFYDAAFGEHEL